MRVIARDLSNWRRIIEVAENVRVERVDSTINELRGKVRNERGFTPLIEVKDHRGNDVSDLYRV